LHRGESAGGPSAGVFRHVFHRGARGRLVPAADRQDHGLVPGALSAPEGGLTVMRILVLHSDIAPDAPPEEVDTITSANAVKDALVQNGHAVSMAPFTTDATRLKALLARENA